MNGVVFPTGANTIGFNNIITAAGDFTDGMMVDETTEAEFLDAMSTASYRVETNYDDFDMTLKMSRFHRFRFGVGYRHIRLEELNGFLLAGIFSAVDIDGTLPGAMGNDPNDILSNEAFAGVGIVNGSGDLDGIAHADTLLMAFNTANENRLNGAQLTFDGALYEDDVFLLELSSNIGIYNNNIQVSFDETYVASGSNETTYRDRIRSSENRFAWATQAGLRGAVRLTDCLQVHVGYEVLFIDGLSLGPNHRLVPAVSSGQMPVDGQNTVLIHGGRVGFELMW